MCVVYTEIFVFNQGIQSPHYIKNPSFLAGLHHYSKSNAVTGSDVHLSANNHIKWPQRALCEVKRSWPPWHHACWRLMKTFWILYHTCSLTPKLTHKGGEQQEVTLDDVTRVRFPDIAQHHSDRQTASDELNPLTEICSHVCEFPCKQTSLMEIIRDSKMSSHPFGLSCYPTVR